MGMTFGKFNFTVLLPLQFSIDEKKYHAKLVSEAPESPSQQALSILY